MVAVTARPGVDVVRASHPTTASVSTTPSAADAARGARCRPLAPGAAAGAIAEEFQPVRSDLKPPPQDRPLERLDRALMGGGDPAAGKADQVVMVASLPGRLVARRPLRQEN